MNNAPYLDLFPREVITIPNPVRSSFTFTLIIKIFLRQLVSVINKIMNLYMKRNLNDYLHYSLHKIILIYFSLLQFISIVYQLFSFNFFVAILKPEFKKQSFIREKNMHLI